MSSLELRVVAAFSGLPDDQVEWFLSDGQEFSVKGGSPTSNGSRG
jgi:hypothetical protein